MHTVNSIAPNDALNDPQQRLPEVLLPTLDRLQVTLPESIDASAIALDWFRKFAECIQDADVPAAVDLLVEDSFWRDLLALTWDYRTFRGAQQISSFLGDVLFGVNTAVKSKEGRVELSNLSLDIEKVALERPYPDLAWVSGKFTFETEVGIGSGIFRLVPTSSGAWKAHVVHTNLEGLQGFPELIGALRSVKSNHGDDWVEERRQESEFVNSEPAVLVIGAGHCGLEMGARLKYRGIPTLIVDKLPRVGDSWRIRYDALSLHDPIYTTHMPYLPFPPTWPRWTPAPKIADWLESYARILDLNVWNSTTVDSIEDEGVADQSQWTVHVTRADGEKRTLKPRHVVFATGLYGAPPYIPDFTGMDRFKGKLIHSTQYQNARDHEGKTVVVVGACTSGHDMCLDHAKRSIDVTMVQRGSTYVLSANRGVIKFNSALYYEGGPPVDEADRIGASYPAWLTASLQKRLTPQLAELDKDLLEGLAKRGFKYNMGIEGSGVLMLYLTRGGGFYFDHGASQAIVTGKIKVKSDSLISEFTENGIKFEDGSMLTADVIILATGYQNATEGVRPLLNPDVANRLKPIWSLNKEGELNSVFRYSGVEGLYFAMGNFGQTRFLSKHLALQIKAKEEGLHGCRYSA